MNIKKWLTVAMTAVGAVGTASASPLDLNYEEMALNQIKEEGTLILSDCPEYVKVHGILAEGTVAKGQGRIYYYHVNETGKPARLVTYGVSDKKLKIKVTRTLRGIPSTDYITTGKSLSFREVTAARQKTEEFILDQNKKVILFEDNKEGIRPDDLVSGIVEVATDYPVKFGVALVSADGNLQDNLDKAEPLPPDEHEMRGTFPKDVYFENQMWDISSGPREINLGSNESKTPFFITGKDELNYVPRENTGNYGITCHLTIHSKGTGLYDLYINPMGGTFQGTLEIGQVKKVLQVYRTEKVGNKWFGHETIEDYMKLGTWEAGKDLFIRFIPPGACYFPIRLLLVPHQK